MSKLKKIILFVFFLGVVYLVVGISIANSIAMDYYDLEIKNVKDVKMVQISDLHIRNENLEYLEEVIEEVNKEDADIVVFTGDLYDKYNNSEELSLSVIELLNKIEAAEKIAILGNHDCYSNYKITNDILNKSNFNVLVDEVLEVIVREQEISFAGVSSAFCLNSGDYSFLNSINKDTIILAHEPDQIENYKENEFLKYQLSGHSHGGQIILWPFNITKRAELAEIHTKKYQKVNNIGLFINYGVGNSSIDFSFYKPKTISVYNFK